MVELELFEKALARIKALESAIEEMLGHGDAFLVGFEDGWGLFAPHEDPGDEYKSGYELGKTVSPGSTKR